MITPHIEHLSSADAYMAGWNDREEAFRAEYDGFEERQATVHAKQLDLLLDKLDGIEAHPHLQVVEVEPAEFPAWEEDAIRVANGLAA